MSAITYILRVPTSLRVRGVLAAVAAICIFAVPAFSQTDRPLTWEQDLSYLEQLSPSEAMAQQGAIRHIRKSVEDWLKLHPESGVRLLAQAEAPTSSEQVMKEVQALHKAVEEIVKTDPAHPFHLGQTEVSVAATVSALSPVADSIDQSTIRDHNATNVAKAIEYIPGVEIQHLASNRNEAGFMLRGFSSNGQVPIYLDGIPMYVPYDGYIDLSRFLTSDLSEVEVAKGYSSPLLGPNALGGSVNLVTRQPVRKFEGDALLGTGSGNALLSSLNIGSRWTRFFVQGSLDWAQVDYLPLSGNFQYPAGGYTKLTVPYALTDEMNNSYSRDEKWSGRVGWTPKAGDEYVFSYINQKGEKGVPLYMGADAAATFKNFWRWPYWNKDSYYFLSNTGLGDKSSLKFRVFYDQFRNSIDMFDDASYTTISNYSYSAKTGYSGSEVSRYDDHTDGISTEFTTQLIPRNTIGASFFFKDDLHRENGVYGATSTSTTYPPLPIPDKVLRDQQASFGLQDSVRLSARLRVTVGFSADHLNGLQAETYGTAKTIALIPYLCNSDLTNTSYSGCTAHYWNYNPQASVTYALGKSSNAFVTFADRGRFPTLKQRYSSGMGSALPNPDLKTEHSRNWNIGLTHTFGSKLQVLAELFRSDLRDAIEGGLVADPGVPVTAVVSSPAPTTLYCPNNTSHSSTSYYNCSQNINIGKETHEGLELEFHSRFNTSLLLDGNYTYLNRTIGNAELPTGVALSSVLVIPTGIPKHSLVGNATVRLPYHVSGLITARYEGGITLQDTTYTAAPLNLPHGSAFATVDLGTSVPVRERFTAQAGVKNVFDHCYYFTAGYPEAGRNWYLNLRYRF